MLRAFWELPRSCCLSVRNNCSKLVGGAGPLASIFVMVLNRCGPPGKLGSLAKPPQVADKYDENFKNCVLASLCSMCSDPGQGSTEQVPK